MKLDPEERIIAAALDEAALNQADERGAGARMAVPDATPGAADNKPCGLGGYPGAGSTNRLSGGSASDGASRGSKRNRVPQ
jgi:hypothetical protein